MNNAEDISEVKLLRKRVAECEWNFDMDKAPKDRPVLLYRSPMELSYFETVVAARWVEGFWSWAHYVDIFDEKALMKSILDGENFEAPNREFLAWRSLNKPTPPNETGDE